MAEHSSSHSHSQDVEAHRTTYDGFIKGSIALTLVCLFVLVALVSFAFGHAWSVFLGLAGLAAGIVGTLIDVKAGSGKWRLSLVLLVLFALITAINVV
jgi:uncharacterized integral membrane protein